MQQKTAYLDNVDILRNKRIWAAKKPHLQHLTHDGKLENSSLNWWQHFKLQGCKDLPRTRTSERHHHSWFARLQIRPGRYSNPTISCYQAMTRYGVTYFSLVCLIWLYLPLAGDSNIGGVMSWVLRVFCCEPCWYHRSVYLVRGPFNIWMDSGSGTVEILVCKRTVRHRALLDAHRCLPYDFEVFGLIDPRLSFSTEVF